MKVHYQGLVPAVSHRFRKMTFPAYLKLLDLEQVVLHPEAGDKRLVQPVAITAACDDSPAGLALGGLPVGNGLLPELLSVYVVPSLRRQGIGAGLVAQFERAVHELGFDRLQAVYSTGKIGSQIFEHLIERRGWSPPVKRMTVVRFTIQEAITTPWFRRYKRRSGFEFFPWAELSAEEARELRRSQTETAWIAEDLVPWLHDHYGFEPVSSLGIRLDGKIVGWVINHPVDANTVRFTCSYIRKDLARRGHILPAYSESISRLRETSFSRCTLTVPAHHPEMTGFIRRWCEPWVSFVGETRGSVKILT